MPADPRPPDNRSLQPSPSCERIRLPVTEGKRVPQGDLYATTLDTGVKASAAQDVPFRWRRFDVRV